MALPDDGDGLGRTRNMATDLRLKESLPALTERIVETYEECGGDPPPRPLAPAELSRGRRDPGRPARDPLSRATAGGRTCTWGTSATTSAT